MDAEWVAHRAAELGESLAASGPHGDTVLLVGATPAPADPVGGLRFEHVDHGHPRAVREAVHRLEPVAVHFTAEPILFEGRLLEMRDLAVLFSAASRAVRLAVFDGPVSPEQAALLPVPVVIGDAAGGDFSERFYTALGDGATVAAAFDRARAGQAGRPCLFARAGISPRAMVVVPRR